MWSVGVELNYLHGSPTFVVWPLFVLLLLFVVCCFVVLSFLLWDGSCSEAREVRPRHEIRSLEDIVFPPTATSLIRNVAGVRHWLVWGVLRPGNGYVVDTASSAFPLHFFFFWGNG